VLAKREQPFDVYLVNSAVLQLEAGDSDLFPEQVPLPLVSSPIDAALVQEGFLSNALSRR
jgi:hypothetical protein